MNGHLEGEQPHKLGTYDHHGYGPLTSPGMILQAMNGHLEGVPTAPVSWGLQITMDHGC